MTDRNRQFSSVLGRRAFRGAAAAAATAALSPGFARAEDGPRPNTLCLVSEDCGAQHLGSHGGIARTPTLDRLAAEGIRWSNCFSAAPWPGQFSQRRMRLVGCARCGLLEVYRDAGNGW
ncbi:hypothetical protein GCM10027262_62030 [Nocardia tengchongensis]